MAASQLYKEALVRFRTEAHENYDDKKDQKSLLEFLSESWKSASPEDAIEEANNLGDRINEKRGDRKIGSIKIPGAWVKNILESVGTFVQIGNYAMTGAPESVGLVWFAVKLTLTAIQSNYELYALFGSGLTDTTDLMIIITQYDRLYDQRSNPDWKPNPLIEKLFEDIIVAYLSVLRFAFAVKQHLGGGARARLAHGIKDFLGTSKSKFQGMLSDMARAKKSVLEGTQAAFQKRLFSEISSVQGIVNDVKKSMIDICEFQSIAEEWHKEVLGQVGALMRSLDDLKSSIKQKGPRESAICEFEKNRKKLNPLPELNGPSRILIRQRFQGTCEWVMSESAYSEWIRSKSNGLLCITGGPGTGKSTLLSFVYDQLTTKTSGADDCTLFYYFSCSPAGPAGITQQRPVTASRICNTLLYQLYCLATEDENDVDLLKECNKIFVNPKGGRANSNKNKISNANNLINREQGEYLPDFSIAFPKLTALLQRRVFIVLDAIERLSLDDQQELARSINSLLITPSLPSETDIHVLVGCGEKDSFYREVKLTSTPPRHVDIESNIQHDIDLKLSSALREVPGLTETEQNIAKEAILKKSSSCFSYIVDIAIPFMREPFQRPLANRLAVLPEGVNHTYEEALHSMGANYVELLRLALQWTLLSRASPTVEEIMDAFYGTYTTSSEGLEADSSSKERSEFPFASEISKSQLDQARVPFLHLDLNRNTVSYVSLQDPDQVRGFCMPSTAAKHETMNDPELCKRCTSKLSISKQVIISEKQGHLDIAITCLRSLNNPLFQKRAGLLPKIAAEPCSVDKDPAPEEKSNAEQKPVQDKENGESASGDQDKLPSEVKTETTKSASTNTDETNQVSNNDDDDGEILDDEDQEVEKVSPYADVTSDDVQEGNGRDGSTRYEVLFWAHHVRVAEKLWTTVERSTSEPWAELMREMIRFVNNTEVFNIWGSIYASNELTRGTYMDIPRLPLFAAAYLGLTCLADYLLDHGAEQTDKNVKHNALQAAAQANGNVEMLKLLLRRGGGSTINSYSTSSIPAFYTWLELSEYSSLEIVQLMLDHGANPSIRDRFKCNALHYFASSGDDPKVLELLLHQGGPDNKVDINAKDIDGNTPLHFLICRKHVILPLLKAFIEHGADVNIDNNASTQPLQMASIWGEVECMKIIIPKVDNIDDDDKDGESALIQAVVYGRADSVKLLAESGANPNLENRHGRIALQYAARYGYNESLQCLLDHKADITHLDKHGRSPLFYACLGTSPESANLVLGILLKRKIPMSKINASTIRMRTPLRQAASRGLDEVVEKLIKAAQAEEDPASLAIDLQDARKGMTALHRAALNGHKGCIQLLLEANANSKIKDKNNKTALILAYEKWALVYNPTNPDQSSFEDIISVLIEKDQQAAKDDPDLLSVCAINGSLRLAKQLRSLGANLNRQDKYGWTPLDLAQKYRQRGIEIFLREQASISTPRWSMPVPDSDTSISEDGLTITHTSSKRTCISTNRPLPAGLEKFYFEVTSKPLEGVNQVEYPEVAVGFATFDASTIRFPGWPPWKDAPFVKSWAYHGDDGAMYAYTNWISAAQDDNLRYGPRDTIGCGVDLTNHTIWFTRNGVKLEHTFSGVQGRLFPVIGFSAAASMEAKFNSPFMWKGVDGTEPVA
ncbi:ankyrin repeat-containing domain protein [Hypoxylon trugodes]|uniref:ankyrin repeat-containing domain protein n=1 Tax=Hypoxylon trugodes TaxID=326681 RepID=UPI00218F818C|nr:ankyrin repeat-containing domain protein [Hypoxylon trugodes]KAI1394348.1 ankyrin repeat-containing domain protein [Hypoxylon trugodes]